MKTKLLRKIRKRFTYQIMWKDTDPYIIDYSRYQLLDHKLEEIYEGTRKQIFNQMIISILGDKVYKKMIKKSRFKKAARRHGVLPNKN